MYLKIPYLLTTGNIPEIYLYFFEFISIMFDYQLSKKEISILRKTCGSDQSIDSLKDQINLSYSRTSEILTKLENKGFINKSNNLKKNISISDRNHAQKLCDLLRKKGHIDWETVLSDSKAKILTQLCYMPQNIKHLSKLTSRSNKTIRYSLKKPQELGILTNSNQITERYESLCSFLQSWRRYHNIKFVKERAQNSTFQWQGGLEFIIENEQKIDHKKLQETGPSKLDEELFYTQNTYIYSNKPQNIYDHIINSLTIYPDDKRIHNAVKKVIKKRKMDIDKLIAISRNYRREIEINKLKRWID